MCATICVTARAISPNPIRILTFNLCNVIANPPKNQPTYTKLKFLYAAYYNILPESEYVAFHNPK